jgi:hypothetical protein
MVLRDNIVEVLATPYLHSTPRGILSPQQSQGTVARRMLVQRHLARLTGRIRGQCLAEEGLRCGDSTGLAQIEVYRASLLVDGAVSLDPLAPYLDVGLVHAP